MILYIFEIYYIFSSININLFKYTSINIKNSLINIYILFCHLILSYKNTHTLFPGKT